MRVNLFRGRQGSGEATFVATTNRPSRRCATATLVELLQQQKSASACYFFDRRVSGRCLGLLEKILQTLRGKTILVFQSGFYFWFLLAMEIL